MFAATRTSPLPKRVVFARPRWPRAAVLLSLPFWTTVAAGTPAHLSPPETVVPIRKVTQPNGGRYFALPVRVGSKALFAGIDTGSPGLRVLTTSLDPQDYRATGDKSSMTFGSGATLTGIRATANVGFGRVEGPILIEVIQRLDCPRNNPGRRCVDGAYPMREMGLMSGGFPHYGAPAMIGLSRGDIPVTVPFPALGVRRWVLDIPNDRGDGRLTLNPAPEHLEGFVGFPAIPGPDGKLEGAIHGCLRNERSGQELCGIIVFDTGAAGISVSSPDPLPRHWPPQTPASLLYKDDTGRTRLVQRFQTGDPTHSTRLFFDDHPSGKQTVIHANASPYFCFDVMYESDVGPNGIPTRGPISLRPRAAGPHDPQAAYAD